MNNFIFCSISRIPLRKRYLVFQRHILTAFFQNCVYHSISAANCSPSVPNRMRRECMILGNAVFIWDASLQYDA